jgi:hypothetical protein
MTKLRACSHVTLLQYQGNEAVVWKPEHIAFEDENGSVYWTPLEPHPILKAEYDTTVSEFTIEREVVENRLEQRLSRFGTLEKPEWVLDLCNGLLPSMPVMQIETNHTDGFMHLYLEGRADECEVLWRVGETESIGG